MKGRNMDGILITIEDLEKRAITAGYEKNVNVAMVKYGARIFQRYISNANSILELGPAEGTMTDILAPQYKDYTIVDAVRSYCDAIKRRHDHIETEVALFEEYQPKRKFDVIIMGSILDALKNPHELLKKCRDWLNQDGMVLATVANSHSLHRQAAVLMGKLESEDAFGEANYLMGHEKIYNRELFIKLFNDSKYNIVATGGYWLKPLTNQQIEDNWTGEMLEAFMKLGEWYPEIAAELYIVAK